MPGSGDIKAEVVAAGWEPTVRDFPAFLGPAGDGAVAGVAVATDWDAQPPELLWRQPIGAGWGGFAVVGDHAVTLEQRDAEEIVACYDVLSGSCEWAVGAAARRRRAPQGAATRGSLGLAGGR